ncbi:MAG: DEAD/DEAH box helicase family protein [Xanthomonadales bacterium]|jgi:type III restriction enzyme|nr:DEAD/DEAH box helicase family protein [Xanthomonadales bacterium]
MNAVRDISQRLSLRTPLVESLSLLAELIESGAIPWQKGADLPASLAAVQARIAGFSSFERDFPSLCFALATGVGKTRLMAAMIAWLYRTGRSRHFLVLAPNLTIYDKLKRDFDPGSDKYLFRGLPDFSVQPPLLVTGEDWDSGKGVRFEDAAPMTVPGQLFGQQAPVINLFNIAKINSRGTGAEKSAQPRLRRLQEYIGSSYFEYLAKLPDLVMLMDEAHRYRADAGARSIDALKPVLGIELTATPKTTGAKAQPFRNIAYHFPLARALEAGYVKEPTVATRKDFQASAVPPEELERIKLEDGVHVHEATKLALAQYAEAGRGPRVHPFMLVVASDTAHASALRQRIESPEFFAGRYAGRVIEIHSKTAAAESDDNTARLLRIERDPSTEIVVHVDKLKEGWDVSTLYTIVPLRASAAEILTEQTIGRGLRLPFGQRTGEPVLDRLTIIAHDRFRDLIDRANDPGSLIRGVVTVGAGGDVDPDAIQPVPSVPSYQQWLEVAPPPAVGKVAEAPAPAADAPPTPEVASAPPTIQPALFDAALDAIDQEGLRVDSAAKLLQPAHRESVLRRVAARVLLPEDVAVARAQIERVVDAVVAGSIEIPTLTLVPTARRNLRFLPFRLRELERIQLQPITHDILLQALRTKDRALLSTSGTVHREPIPENYLVALLMARDEIDYDPHAELLHGLAGQVVGRLREYLADEDEVHNVLQHQRRNLADWIWTQMQQHREESPVDFSVRITRGFTLLRARPLNSVDGVVHPFSEPVPAGVPIRRIVFGGFRKCCFSTQKFDSKEGEYELVRVLEQDATVLKWLKPASDQFVIEYNHGRRYYPDFVVETVDERLIVELKRQDWEEDPTVAAKAAAAARWCHYATEASIAAGGKPWAYLLIPHIGFGPQSTMATLRAQYVRGIEAR